jgi:WD40 repeat protein
VRNGYKVVHSFAAHSDYITSAKFLFSAKQVLTASMDSLIRFWDITTGEKVRQINAKQKCYDMHMSRSESNFITGHKDCIKMWSSRTREAAFTIPDAHSQPVSCVRFTPDELYVATTSKDSWLKIWDVR